MKILILIFFFILSNCTLNKVNNHHGVHFLKKKNESLIMKFALNIKSKLPKMNEVDILGPVLAPITRLRQKYRCRILIRYPKNLFIQKYLSRSLNKIKITSGIKLEVDVDPVNFS